jgi:phospholipid transport system substrate-binding protein
MDSTRRNIIFYLTLAMFMVLSTRPGSAGQATDQLKQAVDQVLVILNDPTLRGTAKTQERRQRIKEIIFSRFDFSEMAKRSLGAHWQKRSPEEQKQFVQLFTSLLEDAYLGNLESYNGEKIRFLNERRDDNYTQVDTKIVNDKGEEFALNYRLQNVNGDWKVFDVVIENISVVNNYRAQFNRVLSRSSYAELVEIMKQRKLSTPRAEG